MKINSYICIAEECAKNSDFTRGKRHGAVLIESGRIVKCGWNIMRPYDNHTWSTHAEICAIRRLCFLRPQTPKEI